MCTTGILIVALLLVLSSFARQTRHLICITGLEAPTIDTQQVHRVFLANCPQGLQKVSFRINAITSFSSKYQDSFLVEHIANSCGCQVVDMTSASRPSHNITSRTRGRDFSAFSLQNEISCVPVDDVSASSTVTSYILSG